MATMSFHGCGPLGIQTNVENRLFQDPNSVLPSPTTFFNSLTGGPLISPVAFDALSSINESGQSREPSPYETASFSAVASDRGSSPASSYLATPGPASPEQPGMLDYKFATSNASYTSLGAEAFGLQQFAQHQNPTSDPGWYSALTLQPQQPQQHVATSYGMPTPPQAFETPQGFVFFVPHSAPPTAVTSVPQFQQAADEPVAQPQPILPLAPGPTTTLLDWDADQFAAFDADQHSHPVTELAKPAKKNAKSSGPRKPVGSLDKKKRNGKQSVTTKRFVCPQPDCGKAFARNFNMQSHLKSHFNIREFACPMKCGKFFSRRHDCARHVAAVHEKHSRDLGSPSSSAYSD